MENFVLAILIAACFNLDPLDWRTWVIGWGIWGGLVS